MDGVAMRVAKQQGVGHPVCGGGGVRPPPHGQMTPSLGFILYR